MTLTELTAGVEARLNDDTAPAYSSAEINAGLNAGQLVFCFLTLCYEKTATLAVAAPYVHVLPSAADYIVPLRVKSGSAKLRAGTTAEFAAANPAWLNNAGAATHYAARGDVLLFDGVTSSVALTYAAAPPTLASGNDVPVIPAEYHEELANYCAWRMLAPQAGQELGKGKPYLQSFMRAAGELAALIRTRSLAQRYDTLPPEREAFDVSRLMKQMPRKERPEWTAQAS